MNAQSKAMVEEKGQFWILMRKWRVLRNRLDQLTLAGSPADDQEVFIRNLQGKSLVTLIIIINMIVLMMTMIMIMITKSMILDV